MLGNILDLVWRGPKKIMQESDNAQDGNVCAQEQTSWFSVSIPILTDGMTLEKLLNTSKPQFLHLHNEYNNSVYHLQFQEGLGLGYMRRLRRRHGQMPQGDDRKVSRNWYNNLGRSQMFDAGFLHTNLFQDMRVNNREFKIAILGHHQTL